MDQEYLFCDTSQLEKLLETNIKTGLSSKQIIQRTEKYGQNCLPQEKTASLFELIIEQFSDTLVKILLLAAVVSAILGMTDSDAHILDAMIEPLVILTVLIVNAIISIKQSKNAEEAINALKEYEPEMAKVIRCGSNEVRWIKAIDLVPGDIVEVSIGDRIPADIRICTLKSSNLKVDQSILTGESMSVSKIKDPIPKLPNIVNQDKINILFSGTNVVSGKANGIVVNTGSKTEIGRIWNQLNSHENVKTPLQNKLDEFGNQLSKLITLVCITVWIINFGHFCDPIHGGSWLKGAVYYFKIAVALAVAAIPEGLPAVITTCLAIGTKRMAKKNAIVRSLPSVETLGSTSVICSDKTGTLTTNQMSVVRAFLLNPNLDMNNMEKIAEHFSATNMNDSDSLSEAELVNSSDEKPPKITLDELNGDLFNSQKGLFLHLVSSGTSYNPADGQITLESDKSSPKDSKNSNLYKQLSILTEICCMCNESSLTYNTDKKMVERVGEATEAALITFAEKLSLFSNSSQINFTSNNSSSANTDSPVINSETKNSSHVDSSQVLNYLHKTVGHVSSKYKKEVTFEFSRDRKSMSVLCNDVNKNKKILFVKGAPENILERCKFVQIGDKAIQMSTHVKKAILSQTNSYATGINSLRCLALAYIDDLSTINSEYMSDDKLFVNIEQNMTFVGLVGMIDPPRPQVYKAIQSCKAAGIRVIMITGDNKQTAVSIARQIGIIGRTESIDGVAYSAAEFDALTVAEQKKVCCTARLFARVEPSHKSRIVSYLQEAGEITAMTGDGVNDAPALKKAEIGVAMGSGTAVAKTASDLVLADDDFSTIVEAVREGRAIFRNTSQFISYLVSSNIGEVISIFLTSIIGMPEGLIPVQLLWVNLITDGLPATALGFNPTEDDIMERPPRHHKEPIIGKWQIFRYTIIGIYVGLATLIGNAWWYLYDPNGPSLTIKHLLNHQSCSITNPFYLGIDCNVFDDRYPMTISLTILVVCEMLNAYNSISEFHSIFNIPPWRNVFLMVSTLLSMAIHIFTLYFPMTQRIFQVIPLSVLQWKVVLALSIPVILLDEMLKMLYRNYLDNVGINKQTEKESSKTKLKSS